MISTMDNVGAYSVCVNANYWQNYQSGIMKNDQCGRNGYWALNHCVLLTGYDVSNGYWTIKNSWGTGWGENGFMRMEMGQNTCGVAVEAMYVTLG